MKICILGAGSYALALALTFYKNNNSVTVWTKLEEEKDEILKTRQNKKALPNIYIPEEIKITTDLECSNSADMIVFAVPIAFFRSTCIELKNYLKIDPYFMIATKGIENDTGLFCHQILTSIIDTEKVCILSGPTFAIDLAKNNLCGLTLASSFDTNKKILNSIQSNYLMIDETNDIIGTEICGSIKNVMAIIFGMLEEMKVSNSTKALFFTEALKEIEHLIEFYHGNPKTITSLAGIGDFYLTCNSKESRNYQLGIMIASSDKEKVKEYLENNTVEGFYTLLSIYKMITTNQISSPLIEKLYQIIFEDKKKEDLLITFTK